MRYTEVDKFIEKNNLLKNVQAASGIYAITIDNVPVYVGQSKDMRVRCSQHIYNTENAMFNLEQKYLLLLAAKLGGHTVDCCTLECCDVEQLTEREDYWIDTEKTCLNIITPTGRNDINKLKIEDVISRVQERQAETNKLLGIGE